MTLVLIGNANVGKSAIFNALTGLNQTVANWPGKTVEVAEGFFALGDLHVRVVDLPGIYSLSAYSEEELAAREFISEADVDAIINVADVTALERNLYLTLQLRELGVPLVVALNMSDLAVKEGLVVDPAELARRLRVPVVLTVATSGKGLRELTEAAAEAAASSPSPPPPLYGKEVEAAVDSLTKLIRVAGRPSALKDLSERFIAIKLLEGDQTVFSAYGDESDSHATARQLEAARADIAGPLEEIHGEEIATIIAAERYALAGRIVSRAVRSTDGRVRSARDRLDAVLLHRVWGWLVLVVAAFAMFGIIFVMGGRAAAGLDSVFAQLREGFYGLGLERWAADLVWRGLLEGVFAGISVALPYLVPFYVILSLLESSGYLARMAFMTDGLMHRLGLHGKAFIPMFLGYGCTVPAVLGTRIIERRRDRLIAGILATLVPCSARTVVILGLVGVFVGFLPALSLYFLNLLVVFVAGRLLDRFLPGESVGLVMEMPKLRLPSAGISARQTWFRLKEFVIIAFPVIIGGSVVLYLLGAAGWLNLFARALAPFTESFLGLPALTLVVLIFGILRKELALVMLVGLFGTSNFGAVLTAQQMYVFALIVLLYIPCVSTIAVFRRQYGGKMALLVSVGEVTFAFALGAAVNWVWNAVAAVAA